MSGRRNGLLGTDGRPPIANGMLVALTLMVAESLPDEKNSMVSLLIGLPTDEPASLARPNKTPLDLPHQ